MILGTRNIINSDMSTINQSNSTIKGDMNKINGDNNIIEGDMNTIKGNNNIIIGDMNTVHGINNECKGDMNKNTIHHSKPKSYPSFPPPPPKARIIGIIVDKSKATKTWTRDGIIEHNKPKRKWGLDKFKISDDIYQEVEKYMEPYEEDFGHFYN